MSYTRYVLDLHYDHCTLHFLFLSWQCRTNKYKLKIINGILQIKVSLHKKTRQCYCYLGLNTLFEFEKDMYT